MLSSERTRALAVIAVASFFTIFLIFRAGGVDHRLRSSAIVGLSVLVALQVVVLALIRRARAKDATLPVWFVVLSVVIESAIPTAMIATNIARGVVPPYAALVAPPIFLYGVLMSLTTLRLVPMLCVLSGVLVASGHVAILSYVTHRLGIQTPTTGLPREAYYVMPLMIVVSGLAAAWVAHELRRHIESALRESETRRHMDRLEHDLDTARSIQRALLPKCDPEIPGFDIAAWNSPADQTGGDYYDWQLLPDGVWLVSVADVCGHGVGPALVTAACRAYVRASVQHHADLGDLTTHVNRLLAADLPEGKFVTMVSALVRPRDGAVTLLSAGHGPIALYRHASGNVEDILPRDLPLAVLPDATFGPAIPFHMQPGDVLALVTDGLVEWTRRAEGARPEQFGLARLRDALRRHASLDAHAMIRAITAEVAAFANPTPQQDDVTIAIIRRSPS